MASLQGLGWPGDTGLRLPVRARPVGPSPGAVRVRSGQRQHGVPAPSGGLRRPAGHAPGSRACRGALTQSAVRAAWAGRDGGSVT